MHYLVVVLAMLVVAALLGLSGCGRSDTRSDGAGGGSEPPPFAGAVEVGGGKLGRDEIDKRLRALASSPAPTKLAMGAMCYKPAPPPGAEQYTCPKCGERTVYAMKGSAGGGGEGAIVVNWSTVQALGSDLVACRRAAGTVKAFSVELDESEFCRKCSPGVETPALGLIVRYGGGEPHVVRPVGLLDLRLITEFLAGSSIHVGSNDSQTPLKKSEARLRELLGIGVESK